MIDTLDKKYGGEESGATTSTDACEKIGVTLAKDEELTGGKKKVIKIKPKGIVATKLATYTKKNNLGTSVSSPSKDRPVGVTYTRKRKTDPKLKEDKKEGGTGLDVDVKEVRRSERNKAPTINEMVHGIKEFGGLSGVGRRYSLSNDEDKRKLDESLIWKLHTFCRTPNEF